MRISILNSSFESSLETYLTRKFQSVRIPNSTLVRKSRMIMTRLLTDLTKSTSSKRRAMNQRRIVSDHHFSSITQDLQSLLLPPNHPTIITQELEYHLPRRVKERKGRMPNKLMPFRNNFKDAKVAAAGKRPLIYLVSNLLIFCFLFFEASAFYSAVGVHPNLDLCVLEHNAVLSSCFRSDSCTISIKRGRILLNAPSDTQSSTRADQQSTDLPKSEVKLNTNEGRRKRWSQWKIPNENKSRKIQALVPHSGRHFFPSHPAYRRSLFRRLFSKLRKRKRFMEGWYYRLTLKDFEIEGCDNNENGSGSDYKKAVSFAFIISIEDPGIASSDLRLACLQAIGPDDQYLVQSTKDDTKFWASKESQSLGCTFEEYIHINSSSVCKNTGELDPNLWEESVRSGFQIIDGSSSKNETALVPNSKPRWMGRIFGHDGSKGGVLDGQGVEGTVEFDFEIDPSSVSGYGGYTTSATTTDSISSDSCKPSASNNTTTMETEEQIRKQRNQEAAKQKSTGGWLSSFPVFEPHWQVTIADSLASGSVNWNGTQYKFKDQPFYAEKNWGDALPSKWYWTQCNSFDNYEGELSITAGGGVRKLPLGKEEELGMVAIHYKGQFYEAVPWKGNVEWNVSTWGEWSLYGDRLEETSNYGLDGTKAKSVTPPFAAEIRYRCDPEELPGLVFRAPTPKQGMVPFCRDTFEADCQLTLWELRRNELTNEFEKVEPPIIDQATSKEGGAEIGGGPWWSEWRGKSELKPIVKALLNFPKNLISKII